MRPSIDLSVCLSIYLSIQHFYASIRIEGSCDYLEYSRWLSQGARRPHKGRNMLQPASLPKKCHDGKAKLTVSALHEIEQKKREVVPALLLADCLCLERDVKYADPCLSGMKIRNWKSSVVQKMSFEVRVCELWGPHCSTDTSGRTEWSIALC